MAFRRPQQPTFGAPSRSAFGAQSSQAMNQTPQGEQSAVPQPSDPQSAFPQQQPGQSGWDYAGQQRNQFAGNYYEEAQRLGQVEDERFAQARDRMSQAVENLPQTFSDQQFSDFFQNEAALAADKSGMGYRQGMAALQQQGGYAGLGANSGLMAGLTQQANLQRIYQRNQMRTQAKLDLTRAKMDADAADALRNLNAQFQLASFENQSPSALGMDAMMNMAELFQQDRQMLLDIEMAKHGLAAQKQTGWDRFGQVVGAAGPIAGRFA